MRDVRSSDVITIWNDEVIPVREVIAGAIRCPFPRAQNPLGGQAQQRSEASILKVFGNQPLAHRLVRSQFGWFVAALYPTAGLPELSVAADYVAWASALQSAADEAPVGQRPAALGQLFEKFDAVFSGTRAGSRCDVATQALESIVDRLSSMLTTEQFEVFAQANRVYFAGLHWQATNRATATVPEEQEYALLRPATSVVRPCLALIEPLEQIRLTSAMRRHRTVTTMAKLALRMACWLDDALSYEEESGLGEVHNLAVVFEVRRQLRPGAALAATVRQHNSDAAEFTRYATSLPSFGFSNDIELRRYVRVLESTVKAAFEWALRAAGDRVRVEEDTAMVG
jgi:hypothetical protein